MPYCRVAACLLTVTWRGLQSLLPTLLLLLILKLLELLSSLLATLSPGFVMWLPDPFGRVLVIYSSQKCILERGVALPKNWYTSSFTQVVSIR